MVYVLTSQAYTVVFVETLEEGFDTILVAGSAITSLPFIGEQERI